METLILVGSLIYIVLVGFFLAKKADAFRNRAHRPYWDAEDERLAKQKTAPPPAAPTPKK
ncbi:MAG: hypothetical protein PHO10_11370 [Gemmiger sp.]|nr:hypothetical protein [Gemmiger sp.]